MIRMLILFSLLIPQTMLFGQDFQLITLTKSSEFKIIEKKTIIETSKYYESIFSAFPKDAKVMIIPSVNITLDEERKESKGTKKFSFKFTETKVAPFIIIGEPNNKYHSIINIADKESYHLPNFDLMTEEPLATDKISVNTQKYAQILNLINDKKVDNVFVVNNVDSCWIMLNGANIQIVDVKLFQLRDLDWLLSKIDISKIKELKSNGSQH